MGIFGNIILSAAYLFSIMFTVEFMTKEGEFDTLSQKAAFAAMLVISPAFVLWALASYAARKVYDELMR